MSDIACSWLSIHNTSLILLEDVKVPVSNLIGKEGHGYVTGPVGA